MESEPGYGHGFQQGAAIAERPTISSVSGWPTRQRTSSHRLATQYAAREYVLVPPVLGHLTGKMVESAITVATQVSNNNNNKPSKALNWRRRHHEEPFLS